VWGEWVWGEWLWGVGTGVPSPWHLPLRQSVGLGVCWWTGAAGEGGGGDGGEGGDGEGGSEGGGGEGGGGEGGDDGGGGASGIQQVPICVWWKKYMAE